MLSPAYLPYLDLVEKRDLSLEPWSVVYCCCLQTCYQRTSLAKSPENTLQHEERKFICYSEAWGDHGRYSSYAIYKGNCLNNRISYTIISPEIHTSALLYQAPLLLHQYWQLSLETFQLSVPEIHREDYLSQLQIFLRHPSCTSKKNNYPSLNMISYISHGLNLLSPSRPQRSVAFWLTWIHIHKEKGQPTWGLYSYLSADDVKTGPSVIVDQLKW